MTEKQLLDALQNVDGKYTEEISRHLLSQNSRRRTVKPVLLAVAAAACVCVVLLAAFPWHHENVNITNSDMTSQLIQEQSAAETEPAVTDMPAAASEITQTTVKASEPAATASQTETQATATKRAENTKTQAIAHTTPDVPAAAAAEVTTVSTAAETKKDALTRDLETVRAIADTIQAEYFTPEEMIRVEVRLRVSDEGEESIFVGPVLTQNGSLSLFFRLFNQYVKESDVTSEIFLTYERVTIMKGDVKQITAEAEPEQEPPFGRVIDGVFYQMGDINMDGVLDYEDANLMQRVYIFISVAEGNIRTFEERTGLTYDLEQLSLGALFDDGKTNSAGVNCPFGISSVETMLLYVTQYQINETLTLKEYLAMSPEERKQLNVQFNEEYKIANTVDPESEDEKPYRVVPIDTPDGLFWEGVYYRRGDVNMNGVIDAEDAELCGNPNALSVVQKAICSFKLRTANGKVSSRSTYAMLSEVIQKYVILQDMGTELPVDLSEFSVYLAQGRYDDLLDA